MEIKLLYFDGCPSWEAALISLKKLLEEEGLDIPVKLLEIKSDKEAIDMKFLGSPSFQVNGEDLWPKESSSYWMNCRVYTTSEGLKGYPTVEMFRLKLNNFSSNDMAGVK